MKKVYLAIIMFILILGSVKSGIILPLDQYIYSTISKIQSPVLTIIIANMTHLGSGLFYTILCLLIFFYNRKKGIIISIYMLFGSLINHFVKGVVARNRPLNALITETGFSFPSAHSMSAMMFYGLMIILIYHSHFKYKKTAMVLMGIMISFIAFTRVYLQVHYFSDVVGGILLEGIILHLLYTKVLKDMLNY